MAYGKVQGAKGPPDRCYGVVHGEVKIPSIDLVNFMNIIIRSCFSNDLSDMKQRWPQLRMVSNSLAKELEWTPEQACHDYNPTAEEERMVMQMKIPVTSSSQTRMWEHAVIWDSYRLSDNLSDSSFPVTSHDREVYEAC